MSNYTGTYTTNDTVNITTDILGHAGVDSIPYIPLLAGGVAIILIVWLFRKKIFRKAR